MPVSFKKGTFAVDTTSATQTVSVGFTPVAVLVWTANRPTADGYSVHQSFSFGMVDATGASQTYMGFDNASSSPSGANYAPGPNGLVLGVGASVQTTATLTIVSGGFSLNWGSAPSIATKIHYMAVGGSDITNAILVNDSFSGTGSKSVTGLSFQPDCLLLLHSGNGSKADGFGIGAAVSSSKQWAIGVNSQGGDATAGANWSNSYQRTDSVALIESNGVEDFRASFTSFNSDGFTVNVATNTGGGLQYAAFLLKTSGKADVGSFTKSTTTNGVNTVSPTFTGGGGVVGVLEATIGKAASTSIQSDSRVSIGAFDATAQGNTWSGSLNGVSPSQAASRFISTKALTIATISGTQAECDGSISGGSFSNTWTTNDGVAEQILWLAFGSTNATTGTIGMTGKKPFVQMRGYSFKGTIALAGAKPVLDMRAAIPVPPVSGSIAMSGTKPTLRLATFGSSADTTFGEGAFGEGEFGPLDYYGRITMAGKKPSIVMSSAAAPNTITLVGRKPVIALAGSLKFSGTIVTAGKKPSIAMFVGARVVTSTLVMAGKKPVLNIQSKETFSAPLVMVGKKPTVHLTGITGGWRMTLAGKKPVLALSGTSNVLLNTAHITMRSRTNGTPNAAQGIRMIMINRPDLAHWPRVRKVGLVEGRR